jgi:hypothetical protein
VTLFVEKVELSTKMVASFANNLAHSLLFWSRQTYQSFTRWSQLRALSAFCLMI